MRCMCHLTVFRARYDSPPTLRRRADATAAQQLEHSKAVVPREAPISFLRANARPTISGRTSSQHLIRDEHRTLACPHRHSEIRDQSVVIGVPPHSVSRGRATGLDGRVVTLNTTGIGPHGLMRVHARGCVIRYGWLRQRTSTANTNILY